LAGRVTLLAHSATPEDGRSDARYIVLSLLAGIHTRDGPGLRWAHLDLDGDSGVRYVIA